MKNLKLHSPEFPGDYFEVKSNQESWKISKLKYQEDPEHPILYVSTVWDKEDRATSAGLSIDSMKLLIEYLQDKINYLEDSND